jgi:hypothetical protein
MYKGDLSNELTKRVLVTTDLVITKYKTFTKKFKVIPKINNYYTLNKKALSGYYLFGDRTQFTLELIMFGDSQEDLDEIVEYLENSGTNPFRYANLYASPAALVEDLPYRPEVVGVIDIPERQLRYGHWGMDSIR